MSDLKNTHGVVNGTLEFKMENFDKNALISLVVHVYAEAPNLQSINYTATQKRDEDFTWT